MVHNKYKNTECLNTERMTIMKHAKRLLALLLCAAMLFGMIGCTKEPIETLPPTEPTEAPTEPPANLVYQTAVDALNAETAVSLNLLITKTTVVAGQTFTEQSKQTLSYSGIGTEEYRVNMEESLSYGIHNPSTEESPASITYQENFKGGILYCDYTKDHDGDKITGSFSAEITSEDAAKRYIPAVLLDAALYGALSSETSGNTTTVLFSEPSAPETWAIPEGAEMVSASGSAAVSGERMQEMSYTVVYTYGPAEITLEVVSTPSFDEVTINDPQYVASYTQVQYPDALRMSEQAYNLLEQADAISSGNMRSIMVQAAGLVHNQSVSMNAHGINGELIAKFETGVYLMDYASNREEKIDQEEMFVDGKFTTTVDDGVPTHDYSIDSSDVLKYCNSVLGSAFVDYDQWKDVVITDLGSTYLIETTYTEDFGNSMQNSICQRYWGDPAFLNGFATAYVNNETTGYLAIDKYTGIPTAAGYYYEGAHTIDGTDYTLSMQLDQSFDAPAKGAYFAITEEMPEEAEPEVKPTPLFYHVTGPNGQEMWLFGTIHVGDERTAYLPDEIYDAFAASDALALEIDSKAFDELSEDNEQIQNQISDAYYYSGGKMLKDLMEEEEYTKAVQYMKASGNYNMNSPYLKASIWSQSIDNFYLRQGYGLHGDQGVEERLHAWAEELDKPIREVESTMFQIRMMTNYSDDLQLLLLEGSIESDAVENWSGTMELYELWCAGDEGALREAINEDPDLSELTEEELAEYEEAKPLIDEYNKAMSYDRNIGMLNVAIQYLKSGDVVFYAVGLAHLLDETNGLVDALRDAGYTVELVEYAN